jgi:hypothetical protein
VADSLVLEPSIFITLTETIGVTDTPVVLPPVVVDVIEAIGVTDGPQVLPELSLSVVETIGVTDGPQVLPELSLSVVETIGVTDGPQVLPELSLSVVETIGVTDGSQVLPELFLSLAETIGVTDAPVLLPPIAVNLAEIIGVTDEPAAEVGSPTGIDDQLPKPTVNALFESFPNPFSQATTIRYDLSESSPLRLEVFDLQGRRVRILEDSSNKDAGRYKTVWDGRNESGIRVPMGIYFYRLRAGSFLAVRKLILLRNEGQR